MILQALINPRCPYLETEPFDEVLDRRIWSLSTERMTWDKELAERRRTAPTEVQHLVEDLLTRQRAVEYISPPVEERTEVDVNDSEYLVRLVLVIEGVHASNSETGARSGSGGCI